ncbi:MAG: hypothetical protein L0322_13915, partial [Chloroflexi bacterium]|nr:hypothetical protein [Chloroflexota bacterium]
IVVPAASPVITNSVTVAAAGNDPLLSNNTAVLALPVGGAAIPPALTGFTANGFTTVTISYNGAAVPFQADIYLSLDGSTPGSLLSSVMLTDPDGVQEFTLGQDIFLNNAAATGDYYFLAQATAGGSTARFVGVYHEPGQPVFVHGDDTAGDNVAVSGGGAITLTFNGTPTSYASGDVSDIQLRGHGGADTLDASGIILALTARLFGGPGDDLLTGGAGPDTLTGGQGNDSLAGGGGMDKVFYVDSPAGVTLDLGAGMAAADGFGTTDTLSSIENLVGSEFADSLTGSGIKNSIYGEGGDDVISGGGDNDILYGGPGDDELYGEAGNDQLYGSDGADVLVGGTGADRLNGQDGDDELHANLAPLPMCSSDGLVDRLVGGAGSDGASYTSGQDQVDQVENTLANCP